MYIEYDLPSAEAKDRVQVLAQEFRQGFESIEDVEELIHRRWARYFSAQYLREQSARNRIVLEEAEIRRLQQGFTTIEELQSANAELVAQKNGVRLQGGTDDCEHLQQQTVTSAFERKADSAIETALPNLRLGPTAASSRQS